MALLLTGCIQFLFELVSPALTKGKEIGLEAVFECDFCCRHQPRIKDIRVLSGHRLKHMYVFWRAVTQAFFWFASACASTKKCVQWLRSLASNPRR